MRLGEAKDHGSAVEALSAALRNLVLEKATIGTEMEGLSEAERHALAQSLPQAWLKDCTNLIRVIRSVKTHMEIGLLTRAAEIAEQAANESLSAARMGTRGHDVVEQFRLAVARNGATYDHFSFSLRGFGICSDIEYLFQHDDVLYIDFGCICNGYFSDSGTTLAFSELPPELMRRRTLLEDCVAAGADALEHLRFKCLHICKP